MTTLTREREALGIAYRELRRIGRIGGFKKSVGRTLSVIRALVPEIDECCREVPPCT